MTTTKPGYKWVGTRPIRHDGLDKVTGRARFGADMAMPGMLAGHVLRSPHAHANIVSIDTSAAEKMDGVKAIVTGTDFPLLEHEAAQGGEAVVDYYDLSCNIVARDKVLYQGHAVAAVAATSSRAAREAAAAIEIEYEVLPHAITLDEAMAPDAAVLHPEMYTVGVDPAPETASNVAARYLYERGDLEAGFAEADVVVEREFTTKSVHQGYIEPHAVVADTDEDGRSVVWCSSQGHFQVRTFTAKVLGWEPSRLKVIPAEIGGGFGGKTTIYLEPLAVLLSRKAGQPVKLVMTRDEVFRASGPTSASRIRLQGRGRRRRQNHGR